MNFSVPTYNQKFLFPALPGPTIGTGGELVTEPKPYLKNPAKPFLTSLSDGPTPRSTDADGMHSWLPSRTFRDFPPIIEKVRLLQLIWDVNTHVHEGLSDERLFW